MRLSPCGCGACQLDENFGERPSRRPIGLPIGFPRESCNREGMCFAPV